MLARAFVIASAVMFASLAFNIATAEDTAAPDNSISAVDGISFAEPTSGLGAFARTMGLELGFRDAAPARAAQLAADQSLFPGAGEDRRRYEIALSTTADLGGVPVDVGVAQRATLAISPDGEIGHSGRGAELRVGRGLQSLVGAWKTPTWDNPTWYFFAASDDEALAWTPGGRDGSRSSVSYQQDRVEIGDRQAGIAIEAGGLQASLAYVERTIQGRYGSADENYTGVTLTWRR